MRNKNEKLVYSTRSGDQRKQGPVRKGRLQSKPPAEQSLKVMRSKKGRKGKTVTVISGFALTEADLKSLSKQLKALCGAGGAIKFEDDGSQLIEVQGDHRPKVVEKLKSLGYQAKLAGG
ncbi:hypothetical protein QUF64_11035 [Anaerolineales bacterium HSG6]|nr:hypothetical protein [Anaerolineales bacterium HSG6]